jgi:uncharacterized membrane protein (Fun14 family)
MFLDLSSLATSIGIGGLATSVGIGGFLGFLMGYAIKKILKIIIIVAGLLVGILYYLQWACCTKLVKVRSRFGKCDDQF